MAKRPTKREVDKRKTTKALRKLRRVADRASEEGGPGLTTWEKDFVEGVSTRLETYGSAFRDPSKGRLEDALSSRQTHIVRVIDKKSRSASKKPSGGTPDNKPPGSALARGKPMRASAKPKWTPRVRDIHEDVPAQEPTAPTRKDAALKVIPGGRSR
ncbi:MAG: hypothetical protein B7Y90_18830 [Alphaproteobacteria bacterium 32-64-14]|nr:MAG: hypothetical protein B7Y90_18830 [Alphaproteobacteria bacterium 32-64-14]